MYHLFIKRWYINFYVRYEIHIKIALEYLHKKAPQLGRIFALLNIVTFIAITFKQLSKMSNLTGILFELGVCPPVDQIYKASNFALGRVIDYAQQIDKNAVVTVEVGSVQIVSCSDHKSLLCNAQQIFDEAFANKIVEMRENLCGI